MRYAAAKTEMLAAIYFVEKYRPYLTRGKLTLRTDNSALSWLKRYSMTRGMAARWIQRLDQYHFVQNIDPGRNTRMLMVYARRPNSTTRRRSRTKISRITCQTSRSWPTQLFDRLPELTSEEAVVNSVEMDQVCKHSRQPARCEWEPERPEEVDLNDREWISAASPQVPPLVQYEIFAIFKEHAAHRYRQEDLERAQEQDAAIKNLKRLTKGWNGRLPDIDGRLATKVRSYYARYKSNLYVGGRGILLITRVLTEAPAMVNDVIMLPQQFQMEALPIAHDQPAHTGESKTANLILEKFDWPALHKDVAHYDAITWL